MLTIMKVYCIYAVTLTADVGVAKDYIVGSDHVVHRDVVDHDKNAYGSMFVNFLIDANLCILNGRNYISNDFASVSTKGCAVVRSVTVTCQNSAISR